MRAQMEEVSADAQTKDREIQNLKTRLEVALSSNRAKLE